MSPHRAAVPDLAGSGSVVIAVALVRVLGLALVVVALGTSGHTTLSDGITVDISESARVLGRRWYIVVPVLAGFALAAMFVAGRGDPDYQASASMVIAASDGVLFQSGSANEARNPLEYMGGQITLTGIAHILGSAEVRAEFEAAGFSPDYTVTVDDKDPLMLVEVSDRDPVIAQATVHELIIRVRAELDALQAAVNAPQSQLLEIQITHTSPPPG